VIAIQWMYNYQKKQIEKLSHKFLTRKEVAELLGFKNEKYINELESEFNLPKEDFNKYELKKVIHWWTRYTAEKHLKEVDKIKKEKPQDELARRQARLKEIEIKEREGNLIEYDLVKWAWVEEYKLLDELLSSISVKLASQLLHKTNLNEVRTIIDNEVKKLKEKISKLKIKDN